MSIAGTGRAVVGLVRDEEVTFLAAAIAYYAFVSLLPALLLALAVASVVGGDQLAARVLDASAAYLAPAGQELIEDTLTDASGRSGATAVGIVLLGWTTLRVFRGLDVAFSRVYGTHVGTFVGQIRSAAVVVLSIVVGIGAMIVVGALLAAADPPVGGSLLGLGLLLVGLVVVFLPLYYVFPGRAVTVREVLPGAAIAAVGWVLLQALFQVYVSVAGGYDLYGVIGGVLLLVTWFYAAAILVLVGAAANVVLADGGHDGNRQEQGDGGRDGRTTAMERARDPDGTDGDDPEAELRDLRDELESFKADVEERTVHRSEIESELKGYVRRRLRRGHARGWGPYLVLLYGTAMTIGAFLYLSGGWAILAMIVVWLSTLGLYVLMLIVGAGLHALSLPGRAADAIRNRRP